MLPLSSELREKSKNILPRFDQWQDSVLFDACNEQHIAVLVSSDFVCEMLLKYPQWWVELQQQPPQAQEWQYYPQWLQQTLADVCDEAALMKALRVFRHRVLVRIAWSQALQTSTTKQTLEQLSVLAENVIVAARDWLYKACCQEWGVPCNAQGVVQPLLILGMGKLGGAELNFSSDVDLIFVYPENGQTRGGRLELDNIQFFTRLGQRLIKTLNHQTTDGFVYRVDMRLRPFGDSGPLVLSFAALENYYQQQGRDWERYAMVKARLMGGEQDSYSKELRQTLYPFVFRRYIDFSVVQSLRNMKGMIAREVRRGLKDNIKLGAGGIREIEFIAQVFQLIRGGREPGLQHRALLPTLQTIAELGLLPVQQTISLSTSYLFLRRLENLLQAIADEQTQTLPTSSLNQARLAWGMNKASWAELLIALDEHTRSVRAIFNELIGDDGISNRTEKLMYGQYHSLWQGTLDEADLAMLASHLDETERRQLFDIITRFHHEVDKSAIGPRGRGVLDQLMPRLLNEVCLRQDACLVSGRLVPLLLSITTRTTYLELLVENHAALMHVIKLCAASPMVAGKLSRYPVLLDELLDPQSLYQPLAQDAYRDELRQYLLRVPAQDEEQWLEVLRQFKQVQQLRIAAADIAGALPVMKVSDHLTYLAEAIINVVIQQAWHDMTARFGLPCHLDELEGCGFAVIAYGKLGGWELGYSSDLDLVFLLDCPLDATTDGERSIDGRQFYLRLAQRIMHIFSTRTSSGTLYEVDARLRPSGQSGTLVSTVEAFVDYQQNEAWTWEHQALVRARIVYGDHCLQQRFDNVRKQILCRPRNVQFLQQEVCEMREKMRQHLVSKQSDRFDIKASPGGITDIEFIAQFLVLSHAAEQPGLTRWSDNVRIFALMADYGIMERQEATILTSAYVTMRNEIHRLALQERPGIVSADCFIAERAQVITSWCYWFKQR